MLLLELVAAELDSSRSVAELGWGSTDELEGSTVAELDCTSSVAELAFAALELDL